VERLLASPHYGECWARHWLDVARYADSNGYEKDLARSIYPYRDWVIDAYNNNMPFDQFAIDQLAGDLAAQCHAGGQNRHRVPAQFHAQRGRRRRSRTISQRIDHRAHGRHGQGIPRFDSQLLPVPQPQIRSHFAKGILPLFAFLNNDDEPQMEVPNKANRPERDAIQRKIAGMEDKLMAQYPDTPEKMAAWEEGNESARSDLDGAGAAGLITEASARNLPNWMTFPAGHWLQSPELPNIPSRQKPT
jgi:hypothetical protein